MTHKLVQLRASQINGCGVCAEMHARELKQTGEPDERIYAVAEWRDTPYFTDAERAPLALSEAANRLSGRPDPVPDEIWHEAARQYDRRARTGVPAPLDRVDRCLHLAAGGGHLGLTPTAFQELSEAPHARASVRRSSHWRQIP